MGLSLPSDSTEVSARGCSSVSIDLVALPARHGDRDDLLGQQTRPSARRPPVDARPRPARPARRAKCRTGGAGSRRSPSCRRAPGSRARPRWCGRGRVRRAPSPRHGRRPSACRWSGRPRCSCSPRRRRRRGRSAPVPTCMQAWITACRPDPHRRSTCMPGTVTGRPASSATTRPIAGRLMLG